MSDDIRSKIFDKLLSNCSINTIAALTRADCGQIASHVSSSTLLRDLVNEALAVAASLDHPSHPPLQLINTADSILALYKNQYGLVASMHEDILHGRTTEKSCIVEALFE